MIIWNDASYLHWFGITAVKTIDNAGRNQWASGIKRCWKDHLCDKLSHKFT